LGLKKKLKFFDADSDPGSGIFLTRDGKIRIWDKRPGLAATLVYPLLCPVQERVERLNSGSYCDTSPRKVLLEQLSRLLPADDSLPDQVAKKRVRILRGINHCLKHVSKLRQLAIIFWSCV
jgi:hypothetical protein